MPDFTTRSTLLEIMDETDIPREDIRAALCEIEGINIRLGGYGVVTEALEQLDVKEEPITILDIGCGSGDMLRKISDWASKQNKKVQLTGIDLNADTIEFARERSAGYDIIYRTQNVFGDALMNERADITTASLFCHHFEKDQLVQILKRMQTLAKKAVVINDLHRHWFAYYAIGVLTYFFARSRLVRYDAKLSVARAFTRKDLEETLAAAGIKNYTLKWRWAWRWQLVIPIGA
jgi:2-polyprenyl-3-methyl-5-hydroxy-6-metoxy-1,4-benzoquinol methylase